MNWINIEWRIDDDGGGELKVFVWGVEGVTLKRRSFESLDDLPDDIAEAIQSDGRDEGTASRPQSSGRILDDE